MVRIKRVYDAAEKLDGIRVLVDRLWPRGVAKESLTHDAWEKDSAPSPELRTWFGHDPARFPEFRQRYLAELRADPEKTRLLRDWAAAGPVTLLYAARDAEHNHAIVLRDHLNGVKGRG